MKELTYITYYDEKMHIINRQTIPYSEACDTSFGFLPQFTGNIYMAPTDGDYEGKNDVVVISKQTGKSEILKDLPNEVDLDKTLLLTTETFT